MKQRTTNALAGILLLLALLGGFSCQKLTEEPKGLLTPSNFYTTPAQCEAAFAASMNGLFTAWNGYLINFYTVLPDGQLDGATLDYGPDYFNDVWKLHYRSISNLNAVLRAVKGGSLAASSPQEVASIQGQARFLRAFNYFMLVRFYGKIPFINEDTPDPITHPLTPESRVEIATMYDNIEADLLFAIANMEDYDASRPARPNLWVAKSLLAKVYLTRATAPLKQTENYAKAMAMADDVIVNGPYLLLPDVRDVFKTSNKNNREMIFAFQVTDNDPSVETANWAPGELDGWDGSPVKVAWAEAYPEQPRKHNYILLDWSSNIYDPSAPIIHYTASANGTPFIGKYNMPNATRDEQTGISRANQPLLRFPDVLLMYAEAANMVNGAPTQLAVDRVNMVIDRANAGTGVEPRASLSMTRDEFDKKVIDERNYELCFEFDRIFDVFRKGLLQEVNLPDNAQGYTPDRYLFPIPAFDATFIGQNPGY